MTETGGFNEIVTTQPIQLNEWINVQFTRTATGMHLYINNQEQTVKVLSGTQNPSGNILNGTEYYFGHDSLAAIDKIKMTDLAQDIENSFDIGPQHGDSNHRCLHSLRGGLATTQRNPALDHKTQNLRDEMLWVQPLYCLS